MQTAMRSATRTIAALLVAAAMTGCASSGGSDSAGTVTYSDGSTRELTWEEFLACLSTGFIFCPPMWQSSSSSASALSPSPESATPVAFNSWREHRAQGLAATAIQAAGPQAAVRLQRGADGIITSSSMPAFDAGAANAVHFVNDGALVGGIESGGDRLRASGYALVNQPAVEVLVAPGSAAQTAFAAGAPVEALGVVANPYKLGWDYQSFGAWESVSGGGTALRASSFGAATPAAAVPSTGTATFTGKLGGMYVSPGGQGAIASADLRVVADFGARSLSLASSNSTLLRAPAGAYAAPHLDLGGTLTYASGSGAFSGTLASAGGSLSGASNGSFYGPAAQELGGVFALKSATAAEAFAGAYGAKR